MPQYTILINEDETAWAKADEATVGRIVEAHSVLAKDPCVRGGEGLQPTSTATTVRPDGKGGHLVTDGAFAEVKEALGGFYLIEVADLDEAIAFAKRVPLGPWDGHVEVRPVMIYS